MNKLLNMLMCPFCTSDFEYQKVADDSFNRGYGYLFCNCSKFPIISGIPVIKPIFNRENSHFLKNLYSVIDNRKFDDIIYYLWIESRKQLVSTVPRSKYSNVQFLKNIARNVKREISAYKFHCKKIEKINQLSMKKNNGFLEYLDLFFNDTEKRNSTAFEYFAFKFGQPRHLVALSLIELLEEHKKPILEIACGFGPITRNTLKRSVNQEVIGTDTNLYMLYTAGRCITPDAHFVCCDANYPLPFKNNLFSTITCFDGLHYIQNKFGLINEIKRTSDTNEYLFIVGSVRNAHVNYLHAGYPYTPKKYGKLFDGMQFRIVSDTEILRSYLRKETPELGENTKFDSLRNEPLLSIIVSSDPSTFKKKKHFSAWPHGRGKLGINPLYRKNFPNNDSDFLFLRNFPSPFYESDNKESKEYLPEQVNITRQVIEAIKKNKRTPTVEKLIESFVVIDIPEMYK